MATLASLKTLAPIGAQIGGAILQRRAVGNATNRFSEGADAAAKELTAGKNEAIKTLQPYSDAGLPALSQLKTGTGEGGEFAKPFDNSTFDLYKDPSYQWRVEQGMKALRAEGNAGGTRYSGATLKRIQELGQQSASQEYQAAFNRYQTDTTNRFNREMGVAGIGEDASKAIGGIEVGTGQNLALLQQDLASALALGDREKADSITSAINGILKTLDQSGTAKSLAGLLGGGGQGTLGNLSQLLGKFGGNLEQRGVSGLPGENIPSLDFPENAGGYGGGAQTEAPAQNGTLAALKQIPQQIGNGLETVGKALGTGASAVGGALASGAGAVGSGALALLSNPITWAAGAALGIGMLWKNSQAHRKVDDWGANMSGPFEAKDSQIKQLAEAGQIGADEAHELQLSNITDYLQAVNEWWGAGGDQRLVARNAMDSFRQNFPWVDPAAMGYKGDYNDQKTTKMVWVPGPKGGGHYEER